METENKVTLTIETLVQVPVGKVWELWTAPEHITQWNFATDEWHCPKAHNELRPGGQLVWRMEAKDGSMGFDYSGVYEQVVPNKSIVYKLDDGRQVKIEFEDLGDNTKITENFEIEDLNSIDLQKAGWEAILHNFKKYAEAVK